MSQKQSETDSNPLDNNFAISNSKINQQNLNEFLALAGIHSLQQQISNSQEKYKISMKFKDPSLEAEYLTNYHNNLTSQAKLSMLINSAFFAFVFGFQMFHIVSNYLVPRGKVYQGMIALGLTYIVNLVTYFLIKHWKAAVGQQFSNIYTFTLTILAIETSSLVNNNMEFVIMFIPLIFYV